MQHQSHFILNETTGNYRVPKVVSATDILDMASFIAMQSFQRGDEITSSKGSDSIDFILLYSFIF